MSQYTGTEITLVKGDEVTIDFIVKDIDGQIQDVTDSRPKFRYKRYDDSIVTTVDGSWVTPGTNGRIRFRFNESNITAIAGDYDCEIELEFPSTGEEITCPDIILHVLPELG